MQCSICGAKFNDEARFCSACGAAVHRDADAQDDPIRRALQNALPPNMRIVRPLGRGGMGAVYLARDEFLDREVAVKVLTSHSGSDKEMRERFRREARIAAKLHHPHIVPLHAFGDAERILYFVMGFVRGETLAERLHRDRTIEPEEARRILAEIADALDYAHAQSVVHRDLKLENILIDDATGSAVLADFGIARVTSGESLTQAGVVVGTPLYMAPEQAVGGTVDHRSDIYSLGVIAYRMLTGRLPIEGETFREIIARHAASRPAPVSAVNPAVAADLSDAVMRCLAKDPEQRYPSAAELRDALRGTAADPTDTEDMRSVGAYALMFSWIAAVLALLKLLVLDDLDPGWQLLINLVQFIPAILASIFLLRVIEGRRRGVPWNAIMRTLFLPPRWYMGWTPAILRPMGDPWPRLPPAVRRYRAGFTILLLFASSMPLLIPLILRALDRQEALGMFGILVWNGALVAMVAAYITTNRSLSKAGLTRAERSIVMHSASWTLAKRRNTNIATLLSNRPASSVPALSDDAATKVKATTAVLR